jgi:hypothetical protein
VTAVYYDDKDGIKVTSDNVLFTTPVRHSPSDIVVRAQYPGAPSARVAWSFAGKDSDLTQFHVVTQADEEEPAYQDVYSGNKEAVVKGMVPLKTHQISVIAVYKDGIEERGHAKYIHTARVTPTHVSASPSVLSTTVHWNFDEGLETYIKIFDIEVFPDMFHGRAQVHTSPASNRVTTISGLASGSAHSVRVTAVYYDETRAESDLVHFTNLVHEPPSSVKVTPQYPGSPRVKIRWSFEGESSALCHFHVVVQVAEKVQADCEVPSGISMISDRGCIIG